MLLGRCVRVLKGSCTNVSQVHVRMYKPGVLNGAGARVHVDCSFGDNFRQVGSWVGSRCGVMTRILLTCLNPVTGLWTGSGCVSARRTTSIASHGATH